MNTSYEISEIFRNLAVGVGAMLSLPLLGKVWQAATIVKAIQTTAENTNAKLIEFMAAVTKILEDHEKRHRDTERLLAVIEGREQAKRDGL